MSSILILFSLLSNGLRASVSKVISERYLSKGEDVLFFNALAALSASLILALVRLFRFHLDSFSVLLSFFFVFIYFIAFLSYSKSILYGSLSFTTLITSLGMVLPMIYGVLFLSEGITLSLIVGFVLIVIALILLSVKKDDDRKMSSKWIFWVTLSFLGSGGIGLFQKVFSSAMQSVDRVEFMASTFFFLFVISAVAIAVTRKKPVFCIKRVSLGFLQGAFDASQQTLNLILSSIVPAMILYPVLNGGATLLSCLISILVFKEKLGKKEIVSMIILVFAIVLISLG